MNGVACAPTAPKSGRDNGETAGKRVPDLPASASIDRGRAPADSKHIPFIS
ncbi:MAG: hypothetical protein RLZZ562_1275 [Planctomycetota bacterium]